MNDQALCKVTYQVLCKMTNQVLCKMTDRLKALNLKKLCYMRHGA